MAISAVFQARGCVVAVCLAALVKGLYANKGPFSPFSEDLTEIFAWVQEPWVLDKAVRGSKVWGIWPSHPHHDPKRQFHLHPQSTISGRH